MQLWCTWVLRLCAQVLTAVTAHQVWTASERAPPTPNTRFSSWRKNSTSTATWRDAGVSRSRTRSISPSARSRSGSRIGGWSGKRRTSFPTLSRSLSNRRRRTTIPCQPAAFRPGTPSRRRTDRSPTTTTTRPEIARRWRHQTCRRTTSFTRRRRKILSPDLVDRRAWGWWRWRFFSFGAYLFDSCWIGSHVHKASSTPIDASKSLATNADRCFCGNTVHSVRDEYFNFDFAETNWCWYRAVQMTIISGFVISLADIVTN